MSWKWPLEQVNNIWKQLLIVCSFPKILFVFHVSLRVSQKRKGHKPITDKPPYIIPVIANPRCRSGKAVASFMLTAESQEPLFEQPFQKQLLPTYMTYFPFPRSLVVELALLWSPTHLVPAQRTMPSWSLPWFSLGENDILSFLDFLMLYPFCSYGPSICCIELLSITRMLCYMRVSSVSEASFYVPEYQGFLPCTEKLLRKWSVNK